MSKAVVDLQTCRIPYMDYFDLAHDTDEFFFNHDMQFTDIRNMRSDSPSSTKYTLTA